MSMISVQIGLGVFLDIQFSVLNNTKVKKPSPEEFLPGTTSGPAGEARPGPGSLTRKSTTRYYHLHWESGHIQGPHLQWGSTMHSRKIQNIKVQI